jgi:hypothetical protein
MAKDRSSGDRSSTARTGIAPTMMGDAERLAVWTLRRIAEGPRPCLASDGDVSWGPGQDLHKVALAVRTALNALRRHGSGRLQLGCSGSLALTRDEQRLLRALSASQSGSDALVDNYLYRITLDRQVRQCLAAAVSALAASLAAAGYWLADAAPAWRLPAPALPVAKLHGQTVRSDEVAWP